MKAKRLRVIVFVLLGPLLLIVAFRYLPSGEPTYEGKPVSVWIKEYAFSTNAVVAPQTLGTSILPDGRRVLLQVNPTGGVVTLLAPTNPAAQIVWLQQQLKPPRYPAREALQALGPKAVPHLVQYLR